MLEEAAEAVGTGEGLPSQDVLNVLAALVDKSMVVTEPQRDGTMRYRLLEPVRQYSQQVLEANGEDDHLPERFEDPRGSDHDQGAVRCLRRNRREVHRQDSRSRWVSGFCFCAGAGLDIHEAANEIGK